jgi:hypothetical protein
MTVRGNDQREGPRRITNEELYANGSIPHFNLKLSKAIHKIPFLVALRWMIVLIFRGPERAERYIREEDRG